MALIYFIYLSDKEHRKLPHQPPIITQEKIVDNSFSESESEFTNVSRVSSIWILLSLWQSKCDYEANEDYLP